VLLDGDDVTDAIRAEEVSAAASVMSTVSEVRAALVAQQRAIGGRESCVMEGRDIGTVVFPDAVLKVYLTASPEERARRRLRQVGKSVDGTAVQDEVAALAARDDADSSRVVAPLRPAEDAVRLDTTGLSFDEQVSRIVELARNLFS
jgi:cytidylate kinase